MRLKKQKHDDIKGISILNAFALEWHSKALRDALESFKKSGNLLWRMPIRILKKSITSILLRSYLHQSSWRNGL
jgi:hypothetical protein